MSVRPSIALIVPTYNMKEHLASLWSSLQNAGLLDILAEIIFVDDGSTDGTTRALTALTGNQGNVRVLTLPKNEGRFRARQIGAANARSERLLFVDSRVTLPEGFAVALLAVNQTVTNVVGCIDIDTALNVYCLYWQRTHEFIFWRHYRDTKTPLVLTAENYDRYLKGTTIFLCSRELFLQNCSSFGDSPPLNDDAPLMRSMAKDQPLVVHPSLRANWVPRGTLVGFLQRLWERGPQFVEYHVMQQKGFFFWIVVAGIVLLAGLGSVCVVAPRQGLAVFAGTVAIIALSTALFSRTLYEFVRMAPLHVTVVCICGLSVLRGILYHSLHLKRRPSVNQTE